MNLKFPAITLADPEWQTVDEVEIPVSRQFGDVYFSKANGLLETRHVFLNGNDLSERLANLQPQQYFSVGETGFGTGLNFLALWQLWQQVRPDNQSHLHFISVEKYPLSLQDLKRALTVWNELKPLADQLIEHYPLPLAGCHRLNFPDERISVDLWLGDAAHCFPLIQSTQPVHAWFLDGFAPSCNPELWQEQIFQHIMRLSAEGTTFASFSVAGVLKRALRSYGVKITRPKGFGHKREMLKAVWQHATEDSPVQITPVNTVKVPQNIAIIGAGIAGLNCAWAFAQRGIQVTIFEKTQPLAGGSGNPLALLNPKLGSIDNIATHLMSVSWQYAINFYKNFQAFRSLQVYQLHDKNIEQIEQMVNDYPQDIYAWQSTDLSVLPASLLHFAGGLFPHKFAQQVLAHPLIDLKITEIQSITSTENHVTLHDTQQGYTADHLIACNALSLQQLFPETVQLKPIRGQISWTDLKTPLSDQHLTTGFSYGGYAIPYNANTLIFGASFLQNQTETDVRIADHQHNFELMQHALPELATQLTNIKNWQGRASLRAQSPDYLPLVGQITPEQPCCHALAGLGSKGFLFSPLCSEIIAAQILGEALPIPSVLAQRLRVQRFKKKVKQL
ncbi:FAD-dependent cmnm(5)s(2)U34 oxidoreductase [Acinetobacter qingfengensis]|uniref:tRNA 5-methylaminomethyl-2-thiouridine biosynthesis bifunctional protein MnmC n=1 Tax=Acinetobacter qingfengensis TaxID=1262585 RepID=A0A1E7RGB7_9GAMM|nr:FAD-dependent cmnm(5)s(2)U34 oxidoreductase [Acinetobacter qingfengensis]